MAGKIICQGMGINSLVIPPFTLETGQLLNIHWPLPKGHTREHTWEMILKKQRESSGIHVIEPVYRVIPFQVKSKRVWKTSQKIPVKQGILDVFNIPEVSVCRMLTKLHIVSDTLIDHLTSTEKSLIGIEVSRFFSNTFLFDTSGLDPLGIQKAYELVKEELRQEKAAIHLVYPSPVKKCTAVHVEKVDIQSDYNVLL